MWMKKTVLLIASFCLAGSLTSLADVIVYENDYQGETVGVGFPAWNWGDNGTVHTAVFADVGGNIVVEHTGTIGNSTTAARSMRFGSKWDFTVTGNTSPNPEDYTISFDVHSVSGQWDPIALEFYVLTKIGGTADNGFGSGASNYAQADGVVHVVKKVSELTVGWWAGTSWDMTEPMWSIEIGGPPWPGTSVPAGTASWDQVWTFDNLKITMATGEATLKFAKNPSPEDEEPDVCRDVVLSWTPGEYAPLTDGHRVFFSDSFDDVNDGVGGIVQTANSYDPPGLLDWSTTYYWRVDEANATTGWDEGDVWQFTVEPQAYAIENITATASSSRKTNQGPENTVNGSGLDAQDLHSTLETDMWLSADSDPGTAWIKYEFDNVYKLHQMWVWNHNTSSEEDLGYGIRKVAIEYSLTGAEGDWALLAGVPDFNQAPGAYDGIAEYAHNTTVDFGDVEAKYVRITAESNWSPVGLKKYGLSEVRFLYIPTHARTPDPQDGATGVSPTAVLNWRAGRDAAEHSVYFGSSEQAVAEGVLTPEIVPGGQCDTGYNPGGDLDLSTTYYWRVDEVNGAQIWPGNVWRFTTADYLVVDDFEQYSNDADTYSRVFQTWIDGAGYTSPVVVPGNGTGSYIGYDPTAGDIMETSVVHGGSQSAPFSYGNDGQSISEATRTFAEAQNWTRHGITTLVLYFYGYPENVAGQLYVKINDTRVNYSGSSDALLSSEWTRWNIDLTDASTVSRSVLQNVNSLTLGIQGNGQGLLLIDDILLYKVPPQN